METYYRDLRETTFESEESRISDVKCELVCIFSYLLRDKNVYISV